MRSFIQMLKDGVNKHFPKTLKAEIVELPKGNGWNLDEIFVIRELATQTLAAYRGRDNAQIYEGSYDIWFAEYIDGHYVDVFTGEEYDCSTANKSLFMNLRKIVNEKTMTRLSDEFNYDPNKTYTNTDIERMYTTIKAEFRGYQRGVSEAMHNRLV